MDTTNHQSLMKEVKQEEAMEIDTTITPPPDVPYLKGAMLPPHTNPATPLATTVLGMVLPTLTAMDTLDNTHGVLMTLTDIKSLILQYEFDKMSRAMADMLQVYVQHGCNKLRTKLPVYNTCVLLFEKYMDQYLEWAEKRVVSRVAVRNASREKTNHLEYKFEAPNLPPFGNKNWSSKLYSSIFYDYSEHWLKQEPTDTRTQSNGKIDIDWQHVSTGVLYVVFHQDMSTGLVSCNLKLKTQKMVETSGLVLLDGMNHVEEGWIESL